MRRVALELNIFPYGSKYSVSVKKLYITFIIFFFSNFNFLTPHSIAHAVLERTLSKGYIRGFSELVTFPWFFQRKTFPAVL
ncbi:hypothetical protein LEP1GSC062_2768 [Leptospira alexanderi serovar Manhao 3 str. L 60]|uniref:Uncharacterized protein n=1 Tax=Leptospira alexanderi serovar Manhao 3 str. L 60 TaxID=1049759 RepID=V6I3Q2_9LEPT|nr:hypothetical protein LEP1GSC062_2768 [Leptospira alexanderi serovar Manhao 3 str. L 60]